MQTRIVVLLVGLAMMLATTARGGIIADCLFKCQKELSSSRSEVVDPYHRVITTLDCTMHLDLCLSRTL
ncbi:hypothetical protein LSAT2_007424 [Lamellibrachia satsuma]|nr:hypothetical protein LSAT2_007424 [Lamellibrachia satsuma]